MTLLLKSRVSALFILFFVLITPVFAQQYGEIPDNTPVLQGGVVEYDYLPPEFYGTWSVSLVLVQTNSPYSFKKKVAEIWELRQIDNRISLKNPNTLGETFIKVEELNGNTARFSHKVMKETFFKKYVWHELPTLTVNDDVFRGQNHVRIFHYRGEEVIHVEEALYELVAHKLQGPTPRIFLDNQRSNPVIQLEAGKNSH